ncbi:MAG: PSD1 and planctomycete cytochrome C domain-containing protein [Gemmataceae bacterium]
MPRYPLAAALLLAATAARADEPVEFNRDVRPILSDACFSCHGFDAKARKAGLRLDTPEGAFRQRKGTVPIKAGDLKASEVWERVTSADPDAVMPPPHTNKKLTAAQRDTLKRWIEQGAKYQKHWAFEPVRRAAVPPGGHPVDAMLAARMTKAGLTPTPEADRPTLIRRVAFALTGLPPTVAEVDAYLADAAPGAYERMVDRYLASPRYGEEMARHWLDVARYADTHGLHLDNERAMWGYRDWVVRAFNQNLPFDRFTVWQLAGDLLPNPTPDQLAATGFNRCNVTTGEGGSIDAEWVYRNAVDRTSTAAQAWLGLTAGCAVCHDHKFDPLSMREFYGLYAFFLSAADPALDGNVSLVGPFERLPTPEQTRTLEAAKKTEAEAHTKLDAAAAKVDYKEPAEGKKAVRDVLFDDALPQWATASNTTRNATEWVTDPPFGAKSGRRVLRQANSFFHQDAITFRIKPPVVPKDGTFEAWVYLDPKQPPTAITVQFGGGKRVAWGADAGDDTGYGGAKLGKTRGPLPKPGAWAKLTVPVAELGLTPGNGIGTLTLQEYGGVVYWDDVALSGEVNPATDLLESQAAWLKSFGAKAPGEVPADAAKRTAFYLANVARPTGELVSLRAAWERARADREAADAAIPATLIFRDLGMPREAFVMQRGQYDKPGDKVAPGVPAVLPPLKASGPRPTRLDLANWLVAKDHPTTARVQVNRLWQQLFGVGLVKTSGDFGSQGEPPSHPELLDWLAAEFAETWDVKKLMRLMVTSAAFKRDAAQAPAVRAKDPENRLLSRGPRFRLDAEQLRDNALAVSGLINLEVGGRAVRTYQPPNIWEPIGYGDSNTRYYLQDHGGALYRRSLYVFIKRTAPAPFLSNFDAPNREQLCAVRDRTNTPLQALQLMNDVQHVEAARALAERVIAEGGADVGAKVTYLYRTLLSRRPDAEEVKLVTAALERQRALFAADPAAAGRLVRVGESVPRRAASDVEVAAWTMVANLLLNLDETVMRN